MKLLQDDLLTSIGMFFICISLRIVSTNWSNW